MPLLEQIQKDMIQAMKARDETRLGALRMIKTALKKQEVDSRQPLDGNAELKVLGTLRKQRGESIEMFRKGGREELAAKEEAELRILETYLPAAATGEEMDKAIDAAISGTGATSMKEMGQVMKAAKEALSGKDVDGKTLSSKVKAKLQP